MKIELMLSKTYIHAGKVYNKGFVYEVPDATAQYLLEQNNERSVFYFRRSSKDDAAAVIPASKGIDKGGKPQPASQAKSDEVKVSWKALQGKGKELGVYKSGMGRKALEAAIEAAQPDTDDDDELDIDIGDDDDVEDDAVTV